MHMITRDQWAARPTGNVAYRNLDAITGVVFHYADQPAPGIDLADEEAAVQAIQRFHMDTRGWSDIAYHALVGDTGNVYQGRRIEAVGAHCLNWNTPSIGVCFLTDGVVTLDAAAAAVQWVQMVEFVALHRRLDVFAHREKVNTNCPGDELYRWVERVRTAPNPLAP